MSAIAVPSADEVRLSPPVRRCHQLFASSSAYSDQRLLGGAVVHAGCRDSAFSMTPEEIVSRLLYRDGLMLIIDKPAGVAVHKGPKGGASLEDDFARCASGCRGRPRWRTGSTTKPPAAWCSAATARRWPTSVSCSARQGRQDLLGGGRGRPRGGRRPHRHAAWPARRQPRLVDEARSGRPAVIDDVEGDGATRGLDLARAGAADRADAPAARALRGDGLADLGEPSTAPRHVRAGRRCICMRARSWCRSIRTSSRSR